MTPPFKITPKIIEKLTAISFLLGRVQTKGLIAPSPLLRKENKIRTVHSSLAIEGNTLSEKQITDILEGKKVLGAPNEILEVKNAISLYESLDKFNPASRKDFLKAHETLMEGLLKGAGKFRSKNVGVLKGKAVVHTAPQPKLVKGLIGELLIWLKEDKDTNQILKSCIAHYEIEFIHPFMDGNGRIGRFWQSLVLVKADPIFKFLPIESIVHARQSDYYKALETSDKAGESTVFIEFMLEVVVESLNEFIDAVPIFLNTPQNRLEVAKERFGEQSFSRKDYIAAVPEVSTATASRDLSKWTEEKILGKKGDRNQTKYQFKRFQ